MFIVLDAIGPMAVVEAKPLAGMLRRGECVPTDRPEIFRFVKDHVGLRKPPTPAEKWDAKHGARS